MAQDVIPGLEGIPIAESAISRVDGQVGRLEYRGISVEDLAEHCTFEEVAFLLLFGELPTDQELNCFLADLRWYRQLKYKIVDLIKCLPEGGHPMEALQASVAAIGMFYSRNNPQAEESRMMSCVRLIAKLPVVVAAFERLRRGNEMIKADPSFGHAENFLHMMSRVTFDPYHAKVLDVCLILHADHTMNASTFAGRVVGSTLATPFSVVSSALGALYGPLHGGANEAAMNLFHDIGKAQNVKPVLDKMFADGQKLPGFGHRVYKTIDPRAKVLKKYAEELSKRSNNPYFEVALEVERIGTERFGDKGIFPNVDFYSGIVYEALGIPSDVFTPVFAISRVAGWLSHWLEQLEGNRIYRPTQKFIGREGISFTKMGDRKEVIGYTPTNPRFKHAKALGREDLGDIRC